MPLITEDKVPSYDIIEKNIREIDNTIIIFRIYYLLNTFTYRFQLMKKDKMCILEFPRSLLENLGKNGTTSERELVRILNLKLESPDCWNDIET